MLLVFFLQVRDGQLITRLKRELIEGYMIFCFKRYCLLIQWWLTIFYWGIILTILFKGFVWHIFQFVVIPFALKCTYFIKKIKKNYSDSLP